MDECELSGVEVVSKVFIRSMKRFSKEYRSFRRWLSIYQLDLNMPQETHLVRSI